MDFAHHFPATTWLWRLLSSRRTCKLYLAIIAMVAIPSIPFRLQGALFQYRAGKIMAALSSLHVGETTRDAALARMQKAAASFTHRDETCSADECWSVELPPSSVAAWGIERVARSDSNALFAMMNALALRYMSLSAHVEIKSGQVSRLWYQLILSRPVRTYPGALFVSVSSKTHFSDSLDPYLDQSSDYDVRHHFKAPEWNTGVYFTSNTPPELLHDAFNLHLGCVWSLVGCLAANDVLPEAEVDRQRIEKAAIARMRSTDQCPDRILSRRARDIADIVLVEVKDVDSKASVDSTCLECQFASFRQLEVLKGNPKWPLDRIGVTPTSRWGDYQVPNSALGLLQPQRRVILFSKPGMFVGYPCQMVRGTDKAVATLKQAISIAQNP